MAALAQAVVANGLNPASSVSAAFGSNATSGNRIVVAVRIATAVTMAASMVTDTLSNTYVLDYEPSLSGGDYAFFSAPVSSSGACTVTFNPGSSARIGIVIFEVSGIAAYGGGAEAAASGTSTTPSSGNITPGAADGIFIAQITASSAPTWETDYATGAAGNGTGRLYGAYDINGSALAQSADATFGGSIAWTCAALWYADTAAAGGRVWRLAGNGGGLAGVTKGLAG